MKNHMAPPEFLRLFDQCSKQALIDALWCACQLGTDESTPQITSQAARNASVALDFRGDRLPREMKNAAIQRIDSDPS